MTRVIPSKPAYWIGTRVEGQTQTREQMRKAAAMAQEIELNLARYNLPRTHVVVLWTEPKTLEENPRQVRIECPVISGTKDRTRLRVIAPNGMDTWVEWKR